MPRNNRTRVTKIPYNDDAIVSTTILELNCHQKIWAEKGYEKVGREPYLPHYNGLTRQVGMVIHLPLLKCSMTDRLLPNLEDQGFYQFLLNIIFQNNVVIQLVKRLLPTPEVRGSNPVIGEIL